MSFEIDDLDIWESFSRMQACVWIMWIVKFNSFDIDLDSMYSALQLDLDIVKMQIYVCTENEVPTFSGSKNYGLNRQTDRQKTQKQQGCLSVGCVPSTAVAVWEGRVSA